MHVTQRDKLIARSDAALLCVVESPLHAEHQHAGHLCLCSRSGEAERAELAGRLLQQGVSVGHPPRRDGCQGSHPVVQRWYWAGRCGAVERQQLPQQLFNGCHLRLIGAPAGERGILERPRQRGAPCVVKVDRKL
ncbi:hypothetical protein [Casimicrobium huifangae]|uniref:hypothetical protein n=1 Tax=Casimicrobium huifangae TaxID=2591109 RepID=UPI001EE23BAC|nr:hypothetical protein [Casimicrobium huifangae]